MYIQTNDKYKQGIKIEEYKGEFSLVSARKGNTDDIYVQWCKVKTSKTEYAAKDMPVGVKLGTRQEAIANLRKFIEWLEGDQTSEGEGDLPF